MKSKSQNRLLALLVGALVVALESSVAFAGATNMVVATRNTSAKPTPAKSSTESAVVTSEPTPVPVSVFLIPRKAVEGKDPFFPNSSRVYGTETTVKSGGAPVIAADITLKGISGTPEQPLAILNTTTCTTGETAEIITKTSRVKVQCLEINMAAGTVLLQIGSERRELRLNAGK